MMMNSFEARFIHLCKLETIEEKNLIENFIENIHAMRTVKIFSYFNENEKKSRFFFQYAIAIAIAIAIRV